MEKSKNPYISDVQTELWNSDVSKQRLTELEDGFEVIKTGLLEQGNYEWDFHRPDGFTAQDVYDIALEQGLASEEELKAYRNARTYTAAAALEERNRKLGGA